MKLVFLDTETTGTGPSDRLIQVAYRYLDENDEPVQVNELFKPPVPISLMAMAVHHIRWQDVENKQSFVKSDVALELSALIDRGYVLVAHNARFDLSMLEREGIVFPKHICTLKVARAADTEERCESYGMQYLRYFYDLNVDLGDLAPHDALADIMVLRELYRELKDHVHPTEMVRISMEPQLIKTMNFGKWARKGITSLQEIARLDRDYLRWLLDEKLKKPEGEEDWIYSLRYYINQ
jgi:DNA polymerase III epsilon subunit-like protein